MLDNISNMFISATNNILSFSRYPVHPSSPLFPREESPSHYIAITPHSEKLARMIGRLDLGTGQIKRLDSLALARAHRE